MIFVRSTGVFSPVPTHSLKEAGSKDYFEQTFAPPECNVYHQGSYHQLIRHESGVHVEDVQSVEVYTQEELDVMGPAQRLKCEWRKISVLDCVQSYGGGTSGSSASSAASSPGTAQARFRLITCHVTAGGEASNIDDPADPSKTANHTYDRALHGYRHVLKCVQLAEAAGHNNVLIGGDFCLTAADWDALLKRAVAELGCKNYVCAATTHGCIVAHPSRLITASNFSMFVPASFPTIESGRPFAYLVRIVWQLESQLS